MQQQQQRPPLEAPTTMLAELLLVLGGHPSSLFTPEGVSPSLAAHLHPGEVASLATLCKLAANYTLVRDWTETTQAAARASVLAASKRGKGKAHEGEPGQYVAVLAGAVREELGAYDALLVDTEALILARDAGTVQPSPSSSSSTGYVPLSLLLATFDSWHAPLAALAGLVAHLQAPRTPGALLTHLAERSATGHPGLRAVFGALHARLWRLWLSHLAVFLLDGVAAEASTPAAPALGLDAGADPPHRLYKLNPDLLPRALAPGTRESILYVGRVAATLQREGRALPRSLVERTRRDVLRASPAELDAAVQRARADVGEWLWTHILTGAQVAEAIESFANYFLTRDGEFAVGVLREVGRLRRDRLLLANPDSSSSVIRAHDLDLALLRASLGTGAENDRSLEALSWSMPAGPLRPLSRPAPDDGTIRGLFSAALLGTPIHLTAAVRWPLDLFMTPPALAAYGDLHAYLYAIRGAHARVLRCWSALSGAQRARRQYTGADEGGAGAERLARTQLARSAWGTVRAMLFFLDQLLAHFMADIVGVQHKRLLEQILPHANSHAHSPSHSQSQPRLPSSTSLHRLATGAPSTPGGKGTPARAQRPGTPAAPREKERGYLDFLTLRQMHARHLAFLREGLFIAERESAALIRDILDTCTRFAGLVERWGGDVLPALLEDDAGALVAERAAAVHEISEALHEQIGEFFRMLLESQAPAAAQDSGASVRSATRGSLSRASLSRARVTQIMAGADAEGDQLMARHVEQLLLRLDFNGVLTRWQEGRQGDVLPPRDPPGPSSA